jgi:ElaB/YqjD/DUF883 family membrane-anchored ribosome-binding protein
MATVTTSTKSNGAVTSAEDLAQQIEALKTDIAGIARTLGALGKAQGEAVVETAKGGAQALKANGAAAYEAAAAQAGAAAAQATDAVRQRPAQALGIAMALGFLVGYMTARK